MIISPVFIMEILLIESSNELFVLLLHSLQIDLLPIVLVVVRIKIVREKYSNIIEALHFNNNQT